MCFGRGGGCVGWVWGRPGQKRTVQLRPYSAERSQPIGAPPCVAVNRPCAPHSCFPPAQLRRARPHFSRFCSRAHRSTLAMGVGSGRSRAGRLVCALAFIVAVAFAQKPPQPPPPTPRPALRAPGGDVLSTQALQAGDPIWSPTANETDALFAEAARRAGLDGIPGFERVQCGGSQSSATLNGTAFGAVNLKSSFGAAGGSSVGKWPERTCPSSQPTCGQAPVPPSWPPSIKSTDCWLCGTGDVEPIYRQEGDATLQPGTRCLTTARARTAGGWSRSVNEMDAGGRPQVDGLGDERHAGVDWRCVGDAAHLFYWSQASGPLSETARARVGPWRGDTLLNDTAPNGSQLVGSFLDAADVSKFVFPLAYTLSLLSYGGFVGLARDAYEVSIEDGPGALFMLARSETEGGVGGRCFALGSQRSFCVILVPPTHSPPSSIPPPHTHTLTLGRPRAPRRLARHHQPWRPVCAASALRAWLHCSLHDCAWRSERVARWILGARGRHRPAVRCGLPDPWQTVGRHRGRDGRRPGGRRLRQRGRRRPRPRPDGGGGQLCGAGGGLV